jgi:hypothetical protein
MLITGFQKCNQMVFETDTRSTSGVNRIHAIRISIGVKLTMCARIASLHVVKFKNVNDEVAIDRSVNVCFSIS